MRQKDEEKASKIDDILETLGVKLEKALEANTKVTEEANRIAKERTNEESGRVSRIPRRNGNTE